MRLAAGARGLGLALARAAGVILVVAVLSVTLMHLAPGDPLNAALEEHNVPVAVRAQWRAQQGRDLPLTTKVGHWLGNASHGDLGFSFATGAPVTDAIARALPYTLQLSGSALVLGFALGLVAALAQARAPGSRVDRWLGGGALAVWAVPEFVIAIVLVELLSVRLGWLPSSGAADPFLPEGASLAARAADRLRHLVLPVLTLALVVAAQVARHQRVALVEAWGAPYIRAARARGISEWALLLRHAWRSALTPTIALAGLALPALVGGAFIIESVYAWPGMGSLAFKALNERDPHLALGCIVLGATMVVLGGALASAAQAQLDSRREA